MPQATTRSFRLPRILLVPTAMALIPLIALVDDLTGPEFGFSIFYLIPVAVAAWFGRRRSAWPVAVLAAVAWYTVDVYDGRGYSNPLAPVWNSVIRFAYFSMVLMLIREYRSKLVSAETMALHDPLTGLANRQRLFIMLEAARRRLMREGQPLTLAYLDLDNFKGVNDRYGHAEGDRVLRSVADALRASIRATDTAARVGGDEFVLLLPDTDADSARGLLERVRRNVIAATAPRTAPVTFSIGACAISDPQESPAAMLAAADRLMYRVKAAGKDGVQVERVDAA